MIPEVIQKEKRFLNSDHMGEYAEVGDLRIHYVEQGSGEPLLLIHSLGQSLYTWHRVFEALAQDYRVFAIDLPGHGYTEGPLMEDYSIHHISELLSGFMDAVGLQSAHICAFSMGALYALDFAERFGERCGRLLLVSPGGMTPTMPFFCRAMDSSLWGFFAAAFLSQRTVGNLLSDAFFDQTVINSEMVQEYYRPYLNKEKRNELRMMLRAFAEEEVITHLRDIDHEVLILWGMDDRWHEIAIAEVFHIALRHVEFALVRNCGHIVHEEKTERFLEHARDFLLNGIAQPAEE